MTWSATQTLHDNAPMDNDPWSGLPHVDMGHCTSCMWAMRRQMRRSSGLQLSWTPGGLHMNIARRFFISRLLAPPSESPHLVAAGVPGATHKQPI